MTQEQKDQLAESVSKLWADDDPYSGWKGTRDFEVTVSNPNPDLIRVKITNMYEHVPLTFDRLLALKELFGTDKFEVDHLSLGGCETCDYGSSYWHEFTYNPNAK